LDWETLDAAQIDAIMEGRQPEPPKDDSHSASADADSDDGEEVPESSNDEERPRKKDVAGDSEAEAA